MSVAFSGRMPTLTCGHPGFGESNLLVVDSTLPRLGNRGLHELMNAASLVPVQERPANCGNWEQFPCEEDVLIEILIGLFSIHPLMTWRWFLLSVLLIVDVCRHLISFDSGVVKVPAFHLVLLFCRSLESRGIIGEDCIFVQAIFYMLDFGELMRLDFTFCEPEDPTLLSQYNWGLLHVFALIPLRALSRTLFIRIDRLRQLPKSSLFLKALILIHFLLALLFLYFLDPTWRLDPKFYMQEYFDPEGFMRRQALRGLLDSLDRLIRYIVYVSYDDPTSPTAFNSVFGPFFWITCQSTVALALLLERPWLTKYFQWVHTLWLFYSVVSRVGLIKTSQFIQKSLPAPTADELNDVCSICIQAMEPAESKKLACGHCFHVECICEWAMQNPICPMCRGDLLANPLGDNAQDETWRARLSRWAAGAADFLAFAGFVVYHKEDFAILTRLRN
jgi:hypothetical protein